MQAKYNQRFCSLAKTGFLFIFPRTESYLSFAQHFSFLDVFVIAIQAIHLSFSKQHKNSQFPWFKPNSSSLNLAFLPPSPSRSHPTMGPGPTPQPCLCRTGPCEEAIQQLRKALRVGHSLGGLEPNGARLWILYGTNQQLEDKPSDKHTIK